MLTVLLDRTYRHLFAAQVVALLGTGLATIALALMAYDIAPERAAMVLGAIFTIKMVAYVGVAPLAGAFAGQVTRRGVLVMLDLVRVGVAVCLPFVDALWQVFGLVFILQSASAAFTPVFQATIPDVLPNEAQYTRALSLSRLAYDLENIVSPMLAAVLLTLVSYHSLFLGTAMGFLASAALVVSVMLPSPRPSRRRGVYERTTRGIRIYLATPRLRGLLALNLAAAAAGAMVLVNTIVLVRTGLGLGETDVALALGAFGAGSMVTAFALPTLLDRTSDRSVMLVGAALLIATLVAMAGLVALIPLSFGLLLGAWFVIGIGYSTVLTPSGRLLARSAHAEDRPAVYAAQFALSHACWLLTYPLSGWLLTTLGTAATLTVLAGLALAGFGLAINLWPLETEGAVEHSHNDLPSDHPHIENGTRHRHPIVIDDYHPHWPRHA